MGIFDIFTNKANSTQVLSEFKELESITLPEAKTILGNITIWENSVNTFSKSFNLEGEVILYSYALEIKEIQEFFNTLVKTKELFTLIFNAPLEEVDDLKELSKQIVLFQLKYNQFKSLINKIKQDSVYKDFVSLVSISDSNPKKIKTIQTLKKELQSLNDNIKTRKSNRLKADHIEGKYYQLNFLYFLLTSDIQTIYLENEKDTLTLMMDELFEDTIKVAKKGESFKKFATNALNTSKQKEE